MAAPRTLIVVHTTTRRYAAHAADVATIRRINPGDPEYLAFDLGELLDPADLPPSCYPSALIVPLRRRQIALLVARVEEVITHSSEVPLPVLVQQRLRQPWACGLVALDDLPVVRIDPRAVVRSAMARLNAAQPL